MIFAAADEVEIEGVDGVAELEEDEVGDVDDVVDRADAEALQAVFEPQGRRADDDVDDGGGAVGGAALEVLDGDADEVVDGLRLRGAGRRFGGGEVPGGSWSAADSRARPTWPRASGLLGVTLMSRMKSWTAGSALRSGVPGAAIFAGRTRMPGSSVLAPPAAPRPSSRSEHSMPSLTMPPMSRGVSVMSTAGGACRAARRRRGRRDSGTFGAPQTTRRSTPSPRSIVTRRTLERDGCGSNPLRTSATTSALVPAPYSVRASTSRPAKVSRLQASGRGGAGGEERAEPVVRSLHRGARDSTEERDWEGRQRALVDGLCDGADVEALAEEGADHVRGER